MTAHALGLAARSAAALTFAAFAACRDGTGPPGPAIPPGTVDPVSGQWSAVTVGDRVACALDRDRHAWCWGDNSRRLLGTADTSSRVARPSRVVGLPDVPLATVVGGGSFQCALTDAGDAYCWGANEHGQLGRGTKSPYAAAPALVAGGVRFQSISAGGGHACGLTSDHVAYCWGVNGALGIGPAGDCANALETCGVASPARVAGGIAFAQVSAGRAHTCGVATDGVAYCWGDGAYGAVGDGDLTHQCAYLSDHTPCRRETPAAVSGGLRFVQIAAARGLHTCGVTISGTAYCWGLATGDAAIGAAELGNAGFTGFNGAERGSVVPVPVEGGLHFRSVTTGGRLSCGLTVDARAVCWGSNNFLQMGIGTASDVVASTRPRDVWIPTAQAPPALTDGMNACAVTTSGRIFCWGGENFFGELGSDPVSPSPPYHVCYRGVPTPIGEVDRSALCYT